MAQEAGASLNVYNTITRLERTDVAFDDPQEPEDYWASYRLDLSVYHYESDWESPPVGALEYEILNGEMVTFGGLSFFEVMDVSQEVHDQCLPFFLEDSSEWNPAMVGADVSLGPDHIHLEKMHLAPALRGLGLGLLMIRSVMIQHPTLPMIGKAAPAVPTPWGDHRPGPKEWRKASRSLANYYKKLGFLCHPTGEGDFLIFRTPFLGIPRRNALLKRCGCADRHAASGAVVVDIPVLDRLRAEVEAAGKSRDWCL